MTLLPAEQFINANSLQISIGEWMRLTEEGKGHFFPLSFKFDARSMALPCTYGCSMHDVQITVICTIITFRYVSFVSVEGIEDLLFWLF